MKIFNHFLIFYIILAACIWPLHSNREPLLNLGSTSFLDGGPIRPNPGLYWEEYFIYYNAHKILDNCGKLLNGIPSPKINKVFINTQIIYQFDANILQGQPGIDIILPAVAYSHISKNNLGKTDSGRGFGDLYLGLFIQFNPIKHNNRTVLVHRLEFAASFPIGKNCWQKSINPGNGFIFVNPYWAGTLFFTENWAASWRLHYLWNGLNKKTCVQGGDAIHLNYTTEYQIVKNLWIGLNGYYLQQLNDDKQNGITVPQSRERVFAAGPGALYVANKDLFFFWNLYFESKVKNRAKGTKGVFRFVKHF
ncbi:MAG: transporter [Candidatus Babeliaceae bacterium]|jgi:hypothetical protein